MHDTVSVVVCRFISASSSFYRQISYSHSSMMMMRVDERESVEGFKGNQQVLTQFMLQSITKFMSFININLGRNGAIQFTTIDIESCKNEIQTQLSKERKLFCVVVFYYACFSLFSTTERNTIFRGGEKFVSLLFRVYCY